VTKQSDCLCLHDLFFSVPEMIFLVPFRVYLHSDFFLVFLLAEEEPVDGLLGPQLRRLMEEEEQAS
jgi:hypothetical protein